MMRVAPLLALLYVLILATGAGAYRFSEFQYQGQTLRKVWCEDLRVAMDGRIPPTLFDLHFTHQVLRVSMNTWIEHTPLQYTIDGYEEAALAQGIAPEDVDQLEKLDADRVHGSGTPNVFIQFAWPWEWPHSPAALAITEVVHDTTTGEIRFALITFNQRWTFAVRDPESTAKTEDYWNTLVHELGHVLGLAHSEVGPSTMNAFAAAGETGKRDLHFDDIGGITQLYPYAAREVCGEHWRDDSPVADQDSGISTDGDRDGGGADGCQLGSGRSRVLWIFGCFYGVGAAGARLRKKSVG